MIIVFIAFEVGMAYRLIFPDIRHLHSADIRYLVWRQKAKKGLEVEVDYVS